MKTKQDPVPEHIATQSIAPQFVAPQPIDLARLQGAAAQAGRLLKALSNPDRLLLLCQMSQGEFAVGELEQITGIRQPTLSQQLTVLREEELVSTRREGKQIFYSVASREALAVLQLLYSLYCPEPAEVARPKRAARRKEAA